MQHKQEILNFFSPISFVEDTHTYYVEGKPLNKSVSGVIKDLVLPVDFAQKALEVDNKNDLPLGSTSNLWRLNSELACAKGNKAHFFGELYTFHRNLTPTDGFETAIKSFWDTLPSNIIPVFTELVMYHKSAMFGGTADIILFNTLTEKYIIADYKTNKDLYKNFKDSRLLKPFSFLKDSNISKYELQFSLYQTLLEQVSGVEVENRVLIWLKSDGSHSIIFTTDYTEHVKSYIDENY